MGIAPSGPLASIIGNKGMGKSAAKDADARREQECCNKYRGLNEYDAGPRRSINVITDDRA